MIKKLCAIIKELFIPSSLDRVEQSPMAKAYIRAAIGAYHALLGCAAAVGLVWLGLGPTLAVCLIGLLYLFKEVSDVSQGGTIRDSVEDTAFTLLGAILAGSVWLAPVNLLATLILILST